MTFLDPALITVLNARRTLDTVTHDADKLDAVIRRYTRQRDRYELEDAEATAAYYRRWVTDALTDLDTARRAGPYSSYADDDTVARGERLVARLQTLQFAAADAIHALDIRRAKNSYNFAY